MVRLIAFLIVMVLATVTHSVAREPTQQETAALAARVDAFEAAIGARDYVSVIGFMPPKMLELVARNANVSVEEARSAFASAAAEVMSKVTFEFYDMDVELATMGAATDGALYALIPTINVGVVAEQGKFEARNNTLGILTEGSWYLVRLQEPAQLALFRQAYPNFAQVEIPVGTMRKLEP